MEPTSGATTNFRCRECGEAPNCSCGECIQIKHPDHFCCKCGHRWLDGLWSTHSTGNPPTGKCPQCGVSVKYHRPKPEVTWEEKERNRKQKELQDASTKDWNDKLYGRKGPLVGRRY
jgi:hypothetical protein